MNIIMGNKIALDGHARTVVIEKCENITITNNDISKVIKVVLISN